jgi:hypothetical protein
MKKLLAAALAAVLCSSLALAGGLEVGEKVSAFYVKDVTGPAAGTKLCYRCRYGDRPVVSIFARDVNGPVADLIKQVDGVVGEHQDKDMKAFVVLLTDEPEGQEASLKQVASDKHVANTPLTTFDGVAGPAPYKLSKDAEITVMMWVDGALKVNESFKHGELTKDKIPGLVSKTSVILN